jgi:hypothetical protein
MNVRELIDHVSREVPTAFEDIPDYNIEVRTVNFPEEQFWELGGEREDPLDTIFERAEIKRPETEDERSYIRVSISHP